MAKRDIQGILIDIDGVLSVDDEVIPGAVDTILELPVPSLYLTNTTTRSRRQLAEKLRLEGFPASDDQVVTAPRAAVAHLRSLGSPPARLVVADDVREDFQGYPQTTKDPGAIVIGDIGDTWSYELLNELFRQVLNGAELIALHKNRFTKSHSGLNLDIGAFIAGLEHSTTKTARIVGKPQEAFFRAALDQLGVPAEDCAMIGDDIESDVGGAQDVGLLGILVKTGKFRQDVVETSSVRPDLVLESIADLRRFF